MEPLIHRGIPRPNRDSITQVMEYRSAILGPILKAIKEYEKIGHEDGLKF